MKISKEEIKLAWNKDELAHSIQRRFEQVTAQVPDKLAIKTQEGAITYRDLNRRANQIANLLLQQVMLSNRRQPVAILMPQGIEMIASALAALKAGYTYIPLDPSVPAERALEMLADAKVSAVIFDPQYERPDLKSLPGVGEISIADASTNDTENLDVISTADSIAYILYTSGSTGKPKGVMQTHKHVLHNTMIHTESFDICIHDRQTLLYPSNVYGAARDTFNGLLNGASLHVLSVRTEELVCLPQWIQTEKITIYCSVATIFRHLINWMDKGAAFPTVRIVKLGGEVVYQTDIDKFKEYFADDCKLSCGLASTETGAITQYFIDKNTVSTGNTAHLGHPVPGKEILLLGQNGELVADGEVGEISVCSNYIARGYWNAPQLTCEKFSFNEQDSNVVYRMGDLALRLHDGTLIHKGRKDFMVKIRGNRIEIPEVEQAILGTGLVKEVVVAERKDRNQESVLVAYLEPHGKGEKIDTLLLRARLLEKLPLHMVPSYLIQLENIPLLPNGKKDRKALPPMQEFDKPQHTAYVAWNGSVAFKKITEICVKYLPHVSFNPEMNFFDVGADSLKLVQIYRDITKQFKIELSLVDLFRNPNIQALSSHVERLINCSLSGNKSVKSTLPPSERTPAAHKKNGKAIAIVGIACRFPQSDDASEFWQHLLVGRTLLSTVSRDAFLQKSISKELIDSPSYVRVTSKLENVENLDAAYFNFTAKEAELLDPQLRVLLECAVEAIEDAGEAIIGNGSDTGVFASVGKGNYLLNNILPNKRLLEQIGERRALLFNDRTYAASLVAYKLDLRGPTAVIDTACSSSLVAIHQAVRSIQAGDCRQALVGGVRVIVPDGVGYEHGKMGIESTDGFVRPFDEQASGTIFGSGAGMLLLKPLDQALKDGNHIYAVIEGTAVTNDGAGRVGFTAPTVDGQAEAIRRAHADAGIEAQDIAFIEAHGTGTRMGDPIEITALNEAFSVVDPGYRCAIGSVKGTLGHLSTASGVTGVIKAALSLKKKIFPTTANFERENEQAPFDKGPFFVNKYNLPISGEKIYAGVSSFGLGGTNAHLVLSMAPTAIQASQEELSVKTPYLLILSAHDKPSLVASAARLSRRLEADDQLDMLDVSYTLANGRSNRRIRTALAGMSNAEIVSKLNDFREQESIESVDEITTVFVFPGQGAQHVDMMKGLYLTQSVFKMHVDECAELLMPHLQHDIRKIVFTHESQEVYMGLLAQTRYSQPVLFAFEYALGKLVEALGITASAYIGHSLGEYVAATFSGVFTLADALSIIVARGELMQETEPGGMYVVAAPIDVVQEVAQRHCISIAAVNSVHQVVVSGRGQQLMGAVADLEGRGIHCKAVNETHAFHSELMEPILERFAEKLRTIKLSVPSMPIVSNLTGTWLGQEACEPSYWVKHLRGTVQFNGGIETLATKKCALVEVGPGRTLTSLLETFSSKMIRPISLCRHPKQKIDDQVHLYGAIGNLWGEGGALNWQALYPGKSARKVPLPTYAFQRKHYWISPPASVDIKRREDDDAIHIQAAKPIEVHDLMNISDWIKDVWTQLLGEIEINADSDFFELGGDSMAMTQLQNKIGGHYGIKISIGTLYQHTTLAELSRCLGRLLKQ